MHIPNFRLPRLLLQFLLGCAIVAAAAMSTKAVAVTEPLDIDANNSTDALTDGLLTLRYMFGLRGPGLVQGAVGANPGRNNAQIETYLAGMTTGVTPTFDIDGNNVVDALTDGLLTLRYLFGVRGAPLIQGAIGTGASRDTALLVQDYLATLTASTPQPPAGCSISASPAATMGSPAPSGTTVQLTASCTSGQQPITFTWDNGAFVGAVRNVIPSGATTYSVVASNNAGAAPPVNRTLYTAGPVNYCQPGDDLVDLVWPASGQYRSGTNGFKAQVYSFKLTIPNTFNPPLNVTHVGFMRTVEVPGQADPPREYTISTSPCDFHAPSGGYLRDNIGSPTNAIGVDFSVNHPGGPAPGAVINFNSGDVIYINFRNYDSGTGTPVMTCMQPACEMLFDFATPNRY